jgi:hypothetical protein
MADGTSPSPRLGARELVMLALGACVLAAAMHWPLPLNAGRDVERDIGDPLVQAWEVAWGGHALLQQPLDFFQANTFWPHRNSLAFSEALAGYAPAGTIGSGFEAAVIRYNVLFLFSYALCFAGAYLLARELGVGRFGAAVAGAAFAYAPWRLEQDGHLHVLSSGGIPLSLFLLLRGYRSRRAAVVLAGWLVAAWQCSLGFTLGLQLGYLLVVLALVAAMSPRRVRSLLEARVVSATVVGAAVLALVAIVLARPYMEVLDDHPEAHRTRAQVVGLSGPPRSFLAAPEENLVWGKATAGVRDDLSSVPEQTLFPGAAIVALALAGLAVPVFRPRLRAGIGIGVGVAAVLSLGFHEPHGYLWPYRWLYEVAPGWEGVRVPGRLTTLTSLGLALLAAAGAQQLWWWLRPRRYRGGGWSLATVALPPLVVAAILLEGSGFEIGPGLAGPSHPAVPKPPPGQLDVPAPQLHLPATVAGNRRYVLWSTDGFPALVNGRGSFVPRSFAAFAAAVRGFPDRTSVALLRSLGVRTVIVHRTLVPGTAWQAFERRPLAGLGLAPLDRGDVVLYALEPGRSVSGSGARESHGRRSASETRASSASEAAAGTSTNKSRARS